MRFGFTAPLERREGCDVASYSAPAIGFQTDGPSSGSGSSGSSSGSSLVVYHVRETELGDIRTTEEEELRTIDV